MMILGIFILWYVSGFALYAWSYDWDIKGEVLLGLAVAIAGPLNIIPALDCKRHE